jgi:hypothetical protein
VTSTKDEIGPYFEPCLIAMGKVFTILAPHADSVVLIGGWAPWMLLSKHSNGSVQHTGSADLDFAFDHSRIGPDAAALIERAFLEAGCTEMRHPVLQSLPLGWSYQMPVEYRGETVLVQIDLLGLEDAGRKKLAPDMALAFSAVEVIPIKVKRKTVPVRVSGAAAIVAMKSRLLEQRSSPKDAADLITLIKGYQRGPESVAEELRPLLADRYMRGAITTLRRAFASERASGPRAVAAFYFPDGPPADQIPLRREAWETVQALLRHLDG